MDFYVFLFDCYPVFARSHGSPAIVLVFEFVHRMGVIVLCTMYMLKHNDDDDDHDGDDDEYDEAKRKTN